MAHSHKDAPCGGGGCATDRREALAKLIGAAGVAILASALPACTVAELKDQGSAPAGGVPFDLADAEFAALAEAGGMVPVDAGNLKILLVRVDDTRVVALERLCPHELCDMSPAALGGVGSWDAGSMALVCNCHVSIFDAEGKLVAGPSPRDLVSYGVTFDPASGTGQIEVESTTESGLASAVIVISGVGEEVTLDLSHADFAPLLEVGGVVPVDVDGAELVIIRRAAVGPAAFEVRDRRPAPGAPEGRYVDARLTRFAAHDLAGDTLTIALNEDASAAPTQER